ncbi:MAG: VTT domain-containing protein [Pseudomonadota bacterium]|nr:VTT domain-containing protein [Pseudomonadota bacterium]
MSAGEPLALFLACLVSGLLVPLPEDVALLVAGWQVSVGELTFSAAVVAGFAGTLGRDLLAFGLGAVVGPRLERLPLVRRALGEARLARAHALFEREGRRMLFFTRFAVGLRAPLYFVGGSLAFPMRRFLLLDALGLLLTVPVTLWLGHTFGEDAAAGLKVALAHQRVVVGCVLIAGLAWWLGQRVRARA